MKKLLFLVLLFLSVNAYGAYIPFEINPQLAQGKDLIIKTAKGEVVINYRSVNGVDCNGVKGVCLLDKYIYGEPFANCTIITEYNHLYSELDTKKAQSRERVVMVD